MRIFEEKIKKKKSDKYSPNAEKAYGMYKIGITDKYTSADLKYLCNDVPFNRVHILIRLFLRDL